MAKDKKKTPKEVKQAFDTLIKAAVNPKPKPKKGK